MNFKEGGYRHGRELKIVVEEINSRKIARLNLFLFLQLNLAYLVISKNSPRFPDGYCVGATLFIADKLHLKFAQGEFTVDGSLISLPHAWAEDANKIIVDSTAAQFNGFLKEPVRSGLLIIKPESPLHKRYTPKDGIFF
ncbi:MAG: hypothetical protein AAB662_01095 [Patescibacteria group bacterium]